MEHIVFLDADTLKSELRRPAFEHTWLEYQQSHPSEIVTRLANATIVITNKVPMQAEVLAQLPQLKMIAVAATGYNMVDIAACKQRKIAVSNIRGYAINSVPEHVFALIFALKRNLIAYREAVCEGKWQQATQFCFFDHSISDLHGATLGIIGAGALGQATAKLATAFGSKVLYAESMNPTQDNTGRVPLKQLLAESDIVSLHCPLTNATRNMIDEAELKLMKPSAFLINTARGGLVNEQALVKALTAGWIAGAGFDVLSQEPPTNGNPLLNLNLPNFILTPHVAWASDQAMQALADQLIDNIEAFVAGKPQHLVT